MSSDFNPNEFRRSRAEDADAPKAAAAPIPEVSPMALPSFNGLQEYVPASVPSAAPALNATIIPDAVPNPYAPAHDTAVAPVTAPQAVPNPYAAALTPAAPPVMAPVPVPAPIQGSQAPGNLTHTVQTRVATPPADEAQQPAKESLIAGLLSKFKKPEKQVSEDIPAVPVQAFPAEYQPGAPLAVPAMTPDQAVPVAAPVSAPPAVPTFTASVPVEITARTKPYLPTWAAFTLGGLTGVILTFAALALMGDGPANTLEARFGADRPQALTVSADVALSEMETAQIDPTANTDQPSTPAL